MIVKYIGATDSQVKWGGNDDPRGILVEGNIYEVIDKEVHSWHTKYTLGGFEQYQFNSVSFEPITEVKSKAAITLADLKELPPFNKNYVKGEEFITWSYNDDLYNKFEVVCERIDCRLVRSANAFKNEMILLNGTVVKGLCFSIVPLNTDGTPKGYSIPSEKGRFVEVQ